MAHRNKVSRASPYLKGILIDNNKGSMRVFVAISFGSLYILTIGASTKRNNLIVIGMGTLTSSPALLNNKVRFLQPSGLVVKYCKPVLCGVPSQTMFPL